MTSEKAVGVLWSTLAIGAVRTHRAINRAVDEVPEVALFGPLFESPRDRLACVFLFQHGDFKPAVGAESTLHKIRASVGCVGSFT